MCIPIVRVHVCICPGICAVASLLRIHILVIVHTLTISYLLMENTKEKETRKETYIKRFSLHYIPFSTTHNNKDIKLLIKKKLVSYILFFHPSFVKSPFEMFKLPLD